MIYPLSCQYNNANDNCLTPAEPHANTKIRLCVLPTTFWTISFLTQHWYHQYSDSGITSYPHCHYLSNETLDKLQFREQCTKCIAMNVEYLLGLTGEQLALWKLHYKLTVMTRCSLLKLLIKSKSNKLEPYVLTWTMQTWPTETDLQKNGTYPWWSRSTRTNKYETPRPFYHRFSTVYYPTQPEPASYPPASAPASKTPQELLPQTLPMPSMIKKRKSLESAQYGSDDRKPPAPVPNHHHKNHLTKRKSTTATWCNIRAIPILWQRQPINFLTPCHIWQHLQLLMPPYRKTSYYHVYKQYLILTQTRIHPPQPRILLTHLYPIHPTQKMTLHRVQHSTMGVQRGTTGFNRVKQGTNRSRLCTTDWGQMWLNFDNTRKGGHLLSSFSSGAPHLFCFQHWWKLNKTELLETLRTINRNSSKPMELQIFTFVAVVIPACSVHLALDYMHNNSKTKHDISSEQQQQYRYKEIYFV